MLALQIMLCVYGVIIVVAVLQALCAQPWERWLIRKGARDAQWLYLGDEPHGFKQFREELRQEQKRS